LAASAALKYGLNLDHGTNIRQYLDERLDTLIGDIGDRISTRERFA
jgi:hypothetical protein